MPTQSCWRRGHLLLLARLHELGGLVASNALIVIIILSTIIQLDPPLLARLPELVGGLVLVFTGELSPPALASRPPAPPPPPAGPSPSR